MAADGTYYYPDASGLNPRNLVNRKAKNLYFHVTLTGGSGTATATVEGSLSNDFSDPIDITDLFGVSQAQATAGNTEQVLFGDDAAVPKLAAYRRVRIKIVLATGADDGDYAVDLVSY